MSDEGAIEAVADAWASIDGKLLQFLDLENNGGYREGYLEDARSLVERLATRGFMVVRNDGGAEA